MTSTIFALFLSGILLSVATANQTQVICSVPFCTKEGAQAPCVTFGGSLPQVTTCEKWAVTTEGGNQCNIRCTGSCFFVPIYGSDGATYCRLCDLYIRACRTRFRVTGPIAYPSHAPSPQLEADNVDTAVRQTAPFLHCSMPVCTFFGSAYSCTFKQAGQPDQVLTCGEYATTSQSQTHCQFVCPQSCSGSGPFDNEGNEYCSVCHLQLASCASNYELYGPSLALGVEVCSEEYCSANGDDAKCLPSRFHTFFITCAQWKASN